MTYQEHWDNFLAVARGEQTDQIPVALIVDSPWMPGYMGMNTIDFFVQPERWLAAHLGLIERFPGVVWLPGFWVEYGMAAEPTAFGARMMWHANSPPGLHHLDLPPEQWGDLPHPDPHSDGLMPFILRRLYHLEHGGLPEQHSINFVAARGPLALATHVLGVTPFLEATALDPDATHAALTIFTDLVIDFLQAQIDQLREPQGILMLDDIPGMLSPRAFKRIALPYLQRIFGAFEGLVRIYHNDTPCAHLLPHLSQVGFDVFNFSHEMPINEVQAALGPDIRLLGNVAPLAVLAQGTPEQVTADARACIEATGGRGLILSAGGGLSPGTPAENIDALARVVQQPAQ